MDELFVSYVAGFFDGEGSAWEGSAGKYRRLNVKIAQVDRTILDRIVAEFGCGNVYSKFDKRSAPNGWKECHEVIFTAKAARKFLTAIEPYLVVKKDKVGSLLDKFGRENMPPLCIG